jgi:hypothetical protein
MYCTSSRTSRRPRSFRNPCGHSFGGRWQFLFLCCPGSDPDGNPLTHTWTVNGQAVIDTCGPAYTVPAPLHRERNLYRCGSRDRWVEGYSDEPDDQLRGIQASPRAVRRLARGRGNHRPSYRYSDQPGKPDFVVPDEYASADYATELSGIPAREEQCRKSAGGNACSPKIHKHMWAYGVGLGHASAIFNSF